MYLPGITHDNHYFRCRPGGTLYRRLVAPNVEETRVKTNITILEFMRQLNAISRNNKSRNTYDAKKAARKADTIQ